MPADLNQTAQAINDANKGQSSQALTIQTYANSVNEQPPVDFSGDEDLKKYQDKINSGLKTAQNHANTYLNVIQPNIIQNISNIGNYYALHDAVPATLPPGSTPAQWIEILEKLQSQATTYQAEAKGVAASLQTLHDSLTTDVASFGTIVTDLNTVVNGDDGVLTALKKRVDKLQEDIDHEIAGVVLSGLAILGGAFMAVVGAVAEVVTVGDSSEVVAGGIGILVGGIAGEAVSAVTLKKLNDEKASLLTEEGDLKAEVRVAVGISSGYQSLLNNVKGAVDAATKMENAWGSLSSALGSMISDLQSGIQNADAIRTHFLTAADGEVKTVIADISTIKGQMAGVTTIVAKPGQTVGEALVAAAEQLAA